MKKPSKFLSLMLCLALVIGAFSGTMTVSAAEYASEIFVGGVGLASGKYIDAEGTVSATQPAGSYAYYESGVLTLNNYTYTGNGYFISGSSYLVYANGPLEIILKGANSFKEANQAAWGVYSTGSLKISEDTNGGSLTVECSKDGIKSGNSINILGGSLTINAGKAGIYSSYGIVEIRGGSINITAEEYGIVGYSFTYAVSYDVIICGGNVSITTNGTAIYSYFGSGVSIIGGEVLLISNAPAAEDDANQAIKINTGNGRFSFDTTKLFALASANADGSEYEPYDSAKHDTYDWLKITDIPYIVTFDSNGGSAVQTQYVQKTQLVTRPQNPTKEDYVFKHWALNGEEYLFDTAPQSDITLTAVWEKAPDKITITYDLNGGTSSVIPTTPQEVPDSLVGTNVFLSKSDVVDLITPPSGMELDAYEIDGVRYEFGASHLLDESIVIKFLWKTAENTPSNPEGEGGNNTPSNPEGEGGNNTPSNPEGEGGNNTPSNPEGNGSGTTTEGGSTDKDKENSSVPQTNDNSSVLLWTLLLLVSAAGVFFASLKEKKNFFK